MMGEQRQGGRPRAFGTLLPRDHVLRRIDRLLNMSGVRDTLAPHNSRRGRPSIAPELLIRMMVIGRLYGITSERRLCEEVRFNLAYRWFCRLRLDDKVPHHSTFSKNRHGRFREAGVLRLLFEQYGAAMHGCRSCRLQGCGDRRLVSSRPMRAGSARCAART